MRVNGDDGDEEMPIIVVKIIENNFVLQTQETFRWNSMQTKTHMSTAIFIVFLMALDNSMDVNGRNILLFVENCATYLQDM